jgi:site-specific DNA recombinase
MAETGPDTSREFPRQLTTGTVQAADAVITMACGDARPVYPGKRHLDWDLPDPAGLDETFAKAQQLLAAKNARQVIRRPRTSPRPYVLRGRLFCGICHRRMQGSWNNDQSYYRCAFPDQYATTTHVRHPRAVYLHEAEVLPELDIWLSKALNPAHLPATIEDLAAGQGDAISPELASLRDEIDGYDRQLAQYRASLDAGGDTAVIGQWITETQTKKLAADARQRAATGTRTGPARMTKDQITVTVNAITGFINALRYATTEDKAEIYTGLNLHLTYNPGPRTVTTRAEIGPRCTKGSCPRGDLNSRESGHIGHRPLARRHALTSQNRRPQTI